MARSRYDETDDDEDDWDESDDYDAERDYDPDDPETYPAGLYNDPELPTVPCPNCGEEILEDSEQCPRCGRYLSREDAPLQSRSGVWIILLILAILAAVIWTVGR